MRLHNALMWEKDQWDRQVEVVFDKYQHDPRCKAIDLATMRQILAAMNSGRPPLLRDVIWMMKMVRLRRARFERA